MKKILIGAVALAILVSPSVAGAAYNDVSLTTDTVITAGGININVAGSADVVSSIEVANDGNSFTVVLEKSSTIKITSADRRVFTTDAPSKYVLTDSCDSSVSTLELASYEALVTIKITPTATICTITRTQATSGTSRGGGGGAVISTKTPTPIARTVTPAVTAAVAPVKAEAGAVKLTRALKVGNTGSDVKQIQTFLNKNGFTVSASGAGSPGKETTYYGKATTEAIKKFQVKYGIVLSGTPETTGYGNLGPKTRAKLNELMGL